MLVGKVAILSQNGIEITDEVSPSPRTHELLARVMAAGICGSDVHRVEGHIGPIKEPICFGHEAVGEILEVGAGIEHDRLGQMISTGDIIYWCPSTPCGTCRECNASNSLLCAELNWPAPAGTPNAAGFRQYATLNKRCSFVRVPSGTNPLAVIAFGCAMPTAIRGFSKLQPVGAETDVVILGCGPVGLACTLLASLAGSRSITVIGDPRKRLNAAVSLGATHALSLSETTISERADLIRKVTGGRGAGTVIEAAGAAGAFSEGLKLLGMNGQYLILGLYSGSAPCVIDPVRINNLNLQIIGSLGIDPMHYRETVRIASVHGEGARLSDLVTHQFPLEQLAHAIETVKQGICIKAIITP
jgi:5-exo-hydroxycamphor dehydrogenase